MTALIRPGCCRFKTSSSRFASMVAVAGSMSINTASAPAISMAATVATAGWGHGTNAAPRQREVQSIGAAADTDSVLRAQIASKLLFEFRDFLAEDVHSAVQHPTDGLIDLVAMCQIVRGRIGGKNHRRLLLRRFIRSAPSSPDRRPAYVRAPATAAPGAPSPARTGCG